MQLMRVVGVAVLCGSSDYGISSVCSHLSLKVEAFSLRPGMLIC